MGVLKDTLAQPSLWPIFLCQMLLGPPEPSLLSLFPRLNKPSSLITPRIACGQVPAQTM